MDLAEDLHKQSERFAPAANDERFMLSPSVLATMNAKIFEDIERQKDDLFSRPVHIGLDAGRFTESQRNAIIINLERSGKRVGLKRQVIFPARRPGALAMIGDLEGDDEDQAQKKAIIERFLAQMAHYDALYSQTFQIVEQAIEATDEAIEQLDEHIDLLEKGEQTPEDRFAGIASPDDPLQQAKAKRKELKRFRKETLKKHKETLKSETELPDEKALHEIQRDISHRAPDLDIDMDFNPPPKPASSKKGNTGGDDDDNPHSPGFDPAGA